MQVQDEQESLSSPKLDKRNRKKKDVIGVASKQTDGSIRSISSSTADAVPTSSGGAMAAKIKGKKRAENTKKNYGSKANFLYGWLRDHHPDFIDSDEKMIILPLNEEVVEEFFGDCIQKRDSNGVLKDPIEYYSFSQVSAFRSCIVELYEREKMKIEDSTKFAMDNFLDNYVKEIAELKHRGEMSLTEGKKPMSFRCFEFLAEAAVSYEVFSVGIFAWLFLLLCWNLMARSVSVGTLMYVHVTWDMDALICNIPKHKGDQEGKHSYPRHIYANVLNPVICPVLAFAVYLWTRGVQLDGEEGAPSPMVFGKLSEKRFSDWLVKICKVFAEIILALGIIVTEIGTHSFRKGVATFLSGCPGGPSAIAIWLRAGWSLGKVASRYIFEGQGGDQFVGRAATGLDLNEPSFAILPPHFDCTEGPVLSLQEWELILPGYSNTYPAEFI